MNKEKISQSRIAKKLIENKLSFFADNSEFSIYDTYETASNVEFNSGELMFCAMVTGRKIMHSPNINEEKIFLPHESFIIAPGEVVEIDFPEARLDSPTTCLTVEITKEKLNSISERLSESIPVLEDANKWSIGCPILHTRHSTETPVADDNCTGPILHTRHSTETQRLLNRLVELFRENHPERGLMIDLGITELVIRLLRHKTRDFLLAFSRENPEDDSLSAALSWIENNLSVPLDIDSLCQYVGMSRSRFYKDFKEKLGCSPVELHQQLRLKNAAKRILNGEPITTISYDLGYKDLSHFCHRFKLCYGCSASVYREQYTSKTT